MVEFLDGGRKDGEVKDFRVVEVNDLRVVLDVFLDHTDVENLDRIANAQRVIFGRCFSREETIKIAIGMMAKAMEDEISEED